MITIKVGSGKRKKSKAKPRVKKPKPSATNRALVKSAKESVKRTARQETFLKRIRKLGIKRTSSAILGVGTRKRKPTKSAIARAGIRAIKGGSAALARFIAARYGAKAIAKYNDYAGRLRRSKRLIKQIVQIDANTFRIRRHIIKTDTAGNNPYSCTCPDFSQFSSEESRDWFGSKAGPFNPCKHMMAVRDRNKNANGKWVCSGGVCTFSAGATSGYDTKALCEAQVRPPFRGGQCNVSYSAGLSVDFLDENGIVYNNRGQSATVTGPIIGFSKVVSGQTVFGVETVADGFIEFSLINTVLPPNFKINTISIFRVDGLADDCGDPPSECNVADLLGCTDPAATNYNAAANVDNGSCTYTVLGCTDPSAINYDPLANTDDGSCTY